MCLIDYFHVIETGSVLSDDFMWIDPSPAHISYPWTGTIGAFERDAWDRVEYYCQTRNGLKHPIAASLI